MSNLPEWCRSCGSTLIESRRECDSIVKVCIHCGNIISREHSPVPFCQTCSNTVVNAGDYCSGCLAKQSSVETDVQTQKRICDARQEPVVATSKPRKRSAGSRPRSGSKKVANARAQPASNGVKCDHCSRPAMPGILHCSVCRTKKMERSSRWRERNARLGRCTRCGGEKDDGRFRTCKQCRVDNASNKRSRRLAKAGLI